MWEQIRSNEMRSVFIIAFMGALLLAVGYIIGVYFLDSPITGIAIAGVVWIIMNITAYFQGDSILLSVAGARKIKKEDHPRLFNVVEEMAIASGLSRMPDVYIIDDPALNAFATGRDPEHASVAITSGLLQKLNRDELQGVIAHEIGHVNNRDILLMSISAVLMGSIIIIAYYASRMIFYSGGGRSRRSSSDGGGGGAIILIIGIVFLILAPIFAQLMYFALSRRREYLADASSALYTRYPEGLASALEKLGASTTQVKTANQATAPMYIVNPFRQEGRAAADLTSTHPPISERIRVLRAMGGASYRDYEQAFEKVKHQRVLGAATIAATAGAIGLRTPSSEGAVGEPDQSQRTRETQDTLWRMNNYKSFKCFNCGTLLRIPPAYNNPLVRCPHCGATNQVP